MHPVHPTRKAHPHSKLLLFEAFCYLGFTIFLFLILGAATDANPAAVLLAFFPAVVFGIVLIALLQTDHFEVSYTWLAFTMLLVIAGLVYFTVPTGQGLDIATVLLMNAIIMGVGLATMHVSYAHEPVIHEHELHRHAEIHAQHRSAERDAVHEHHVVHHHVTEPVKEPVKQQVKDTVVEDEVATVVQSIEDKIKALNFVIGRVYSVYKGGTERLRNKIRVDKAWYEDFNVIDHKDSARRRAEALVLLGKIKDRLDVLEKSEQSVFGEEHTKLRNLARNPNGTDKVIDVLIRNDKDPAKQYYDGARSFCEDGIKKLSTGKNA